MDRETAATSDGHGEDALGRTLRKGSRVARLGNLVFGPRHLVPNIVGLVLLAPVGFLILMGLLEVDTGLLGLTNPSPVPATLDQIATNSVQDGRLWVTVSGRLEPESHPWIWKGLDYGRAYVVADSASGSGLVVVSDQPLGQPGSEITVTGFLWRGWHVWANGSNWNDWARATYPSAGMMDDVYMTYEGPPGSGAAAVGLVLLAGAGLIIALYVRWRVRRKTPPSWSFVYPGSWPSPYGPGGADTLGYRPPLSQVGLAAAPEWPASAVGAEPSTTGSTALAGRATDGPGTPCSVYPIQSQGATILPRKFDVQFAADSFQGAFVMALAEKLNPKFPGVGSPDYDLVIRSRIVRADPGSKFLRWLFPFVAGSAVFEVEAQLTERGALLAHIRGNGTRRFGLGGGNSQDLLADAAKLAGEHAAEMLLDVVDTEGAGRGK